MPFRVRIDGKEVVLEKRTTILNAARRAGIDIPSLCYDERLQPYGSCRLCLVEVKGKGLVTSCSTFVEDGMEVSTETPEVVKHRKTILELLASRYPAEAAKLDTRLSQLLRRYGVEAKGAENPRLMDERHPWISVDLSRCVLCYNCVRVCEGYIGRLIWRTLYRGQQTIVMPETGSLATSSCISCRACVDVCPSGAIVDKVMASARPTSWGETACSMCSLSCPLRVGFEDSRPVYVEGRRDLLPFAAECLRGKYHWEDLVYVPERPEGPRLRREGRSWSRASIDEALGVIAEGLRKAMGEGGPGSVGVIVSSRLPAEAYYLSQLLARAALRTNNVDVASSLLSSFSELAPIGGPLPTLPLSSLDDVDSFLVIGPLEDYHPALASFIRRQSLQGRSRLILISSEDDKLANAADVHMAVDVRRAPDALRAIEVAAAAEGLMDVPSASKLLPDAASRALALRSLSPAEEARRAGIDEAAAREAAQALSKGKAVVVAELDGTPGVASEALALSALLGVLSRPGSGLVPLLSYFDNAEARRFGVGPSTLPGGRGLSEAEELSKAWGIEVPGQEGMTAPEMIEAARDGRMKALVIVGGDLASPSPLREGVLEALYRVPFVVSLSPVAGVGVEYASHVHVPLASHVEEEGVYVSVDGRLTLARGTRAFRGSVRSWEVLARLLVLMGYPRAYSSARDVWDELRSLDPGLSGLSYEAIASGSARVELRQAARA